MGATRMATTIKVRKETARKLTRLLGKLIVKSGKKISYDDVITYLLELEEKSNQEMQQKQKKLSDAAKRILGMIEHSVSGAGPEDFAEYDYDDNEG